MTSTPDIALPTDLTQATPPSSHQKFRTWFKRGLIIAILGWIIFACGLSLTIHYWGSVDQSVESDVIVVLGAGLRRDGRPGWALTRRSQHAADLWHQGKAPIVMCTGAQADGYPRSEAEVCRDLLLDSGVPASAIIVEDQSRSTEENAINACKIMEEQGWDTVIIVSDSFHVYRGYILFTQQGLQVTTSPVSASRINNGWFYFYSIGREIVALHWQFIKDTLNLPVTHLYGI